MNAIIPKYISIDPRELMSLLISISDRGDRCNKRAEFIDAMRRDLVRAGLPVFGLTLLKEEKGELYLVTMADLSFLDSQADNSPTHARISITTESLLADERARKGSPIAPCFDGIAVRTPGVVLDDHISCHEFSWSRFIDYFSSLNPLVSRVWGNNDGNRDVLIVPVKCGDRILGALQLMCSSTFAVSADDYRNLVLISRVIGSAYSSLVNRNRAVASEQKYTTIRESVPLGIFIVDREYRVIDENSRFNKWFNSGNRFPDEKTIMLDDSENPFGSFCRECAAETFSTGKGQIKDRTFSLRGKEEVFRIRTSPVFSDAGEVTGVMEIVIDITIEAGEERRVKNRKEELEFEVARKIETLREKETNLTALVNSVRTLETSAGRADSISHIARGYENLGAKCVIFALCENDHLRIDSVHPRTMNRWLGDATGLNPTDLSFRIDENDSAFTASLSMNNPVFYVGEDGVNEFCHVLFTGVMDEKVRAACRILKGLSVVVFPLVSKNGREGIIAVAAEQEKIENIFEYCLLLSSSAAVELSRLRNAEHLHCSELKYRNLVETSRDMITLCDREGRISYSNSAFFRKTGLNGDDLAGTAIYDFFEGTDRSRLESVVRACFERAADPGPSEFIMKMPSGPEIWTELSINNVSNGNSACQIVLRDITSRKNLEVEIGSLTAFQEKILQNEIIGIITMTPDGHITNWNRGAINILGYSEKEVLGSNFFDLVVTGERPVKKKGRHAMVNAGSSSVQIELLRKDLSGIHVMYFESMMRDAQNKPSVIIAFFFDVTEKVSLERESKELMIQLTQAQNVTILSLARLTEYRDIETGSHLERIMRYTELLANKLSSYKEYRDYISREYIQDLVNSCPLHDIGKVGIPDQILHKPGKLTAGEFEIMKNHTVIGGDTIQQAEEKLRGRSYLLLGKEVAYYHHERWDGSGYPRGLKGEDIPLSARIVAVADVYDALTSRRPYKEAYPHDKASEIIRSSAGTHFDESIVKAFSGCENEFRKYTAGLH